MIETPFYFPNGSHSLFGILHRPAAATTKPAFVFCHPFGEEKLWAHRVFVMFARTLAADGHTVLRFDYMGNGDSDGEFKQSSLATALSDVRCAIDRVRADVNATKVSLLGLRLGATIAALIAEEAANIDRLILWAPIVDGTRYMQEMLRINLSTQMAVYKEVRQDREALVASMRQGDTVNIDGYEVPIAMYDEVAAVKLAAQEKRFNGDALVLHVDRQPNAPSGAELQQLAATYRRGTLSFAQEEPFWKEILRSYQVEPPNLFATTLAWIQQPAGAPAATQPQAQ